VDRAQRGYGSNVTHDRKPHVSAERLAIVGDVRSVAAATVHSTGHRSSLITAAGEHDGFVIFVIVFVRFVVRP
jgi:hypothetical protein